MSDNKENIAPASDLDRSSRQNVINTESDCFRRLKAEAKTARFEYAADEPQIYKIDSISEDLKRWEVSIMPSQHSLYFGGTFELSLVFPQSYPYHPPVATFNTKIFHPNIGSDGIVATPQFLDQWTPVLTSDRNIRMIIVDLDTHFLEDELYIRNTEAADLIATDVDKYEQTVAEWLVQYALPSTDPIDTGQTKKATSPLDELSNSLVILDLDEETEFLQDWTIV